MLFIYLFFIFCRGKEVIYILDIDVSFILMIVLFIKYVFFMICKFSLLGNLL